MKNRAWAAGLLCALFLCILFASCDDNQEEDYSISEITIYNIPEEIPVANNPEKKSETFKVYLNASDYQEPDKPSAAKGVAKITSGTKQTDGRYSVTIKLQNPNPAGDKNPNTDTGPWSGTANYFSVVISPESVKTDKVKAIWAKASLKRLDKGMASCNWDTLIDFRKPPQGMDLGFDEKIQAMFNDIVSEDPDIEK